MRRILASIMALGLLAAILPGTTVGASHGERLVIQDSALTDVSGTGTFVASGPAVDAGLFCATGTSETDGVSALVTKGSLVYFAAVRRLTCDGGGAVHEFSLNVILNAVTGRTTASWEITSGGLA